MNDGVYFTPSAGAVTASQSGPVCSLPPATHPTCKVDTLGKCPMGVILTLVVITHLLI